MYDTRDLELNRAYQHDMQRYAQQAKLAREVQQPNYAKRRFQTLIDEFRNHLAQLSLHI